MQIKIQLSLNNFPKWSWECDVFVGCLHNVKCLLMVI